MLNLDMSLEEILEIAARVITFLLVIPIHESAHGLVAKWLGDDTADRSGRISLNPFVHFDIVGFVMMLLFGVGFAKPVPVDPSRFKHRRRGYAFVSLAGPVSNLLAALLGALILEFYICIKFGNDSIPVNDVSNLTEAIYTILIYFVQINIMLAIFNLIPLPPLDGFNCLRAFMPAKADMWLLQNQRVLSGAFFVLIILSSHIPQIRIAFLTVVYVVQMGVYTLVSWVPLLFK